MNNQAHNSVTVVDLEKRKPIDVITGFAQPRQGIKVSSDGKYIFVTNFQGDKVSIVDATTKKSFVKYQGSPVYAESRLPLMEEHYMPQTADATAFPQSIR